MGNDQLDREDIFNLYITVRKTASEIDANTIALAIPMIPYKSPRSNINEIWIPKNIVEPIITYLLFSKAKNLEFKTKLIEIGIIAILIILITSMASINLGKKKFDIAGPNKITIPVKIIETITEPFCNL